MSVFSAGMNHRSFWGQINALCFVLGLLLAAATFTATQINRAGFSPNNPALSYGSGIQVAAEKAAQSESEIKKLREDKTELENKLAKGSDAAKTLNNELQDIKFLAGLMEAVGPGIQITLTDSTKHAAIPGSPIDLDDYVHDSDIVSVVNELRAAGAEAIAVNGQRVGASTAIRCVGPVIQVNLVPLAPPYIIQAIGDPNTLYGGMNMSNSVLDMLRHNDPNRVRLEKKTKLQLPAYTGSTQVHFARPPGTPASQSEKDTQEK
jgi:uncharacterized protein YlxW (UPF0749 family)